MILDRLRAELAELIAAHRANRNKLNTLIEENRRILGETGEIDVLRSLVARWRADVGTLISTRRELKREHREGENQ